jgi:hypothetical protein
VVLKLTRLAVPILAALAAFDSQAADPSAAEVKADPAIVRNAVEAGERAWRAATRQPPPANLSSRELFIYALALCEAKQNPERLERLFEVAGRMQQRDPNSRGYGNFRWSWSHEDVWDFNAVDFCMQAGALLWLRHRDAMPAGAREKLQPILELAAQGLLRHRVAESYTNIALMNAGDLMLLGEALGKPDVAEEGYARLDRILLYMAEGGIHEYVSPTYYGVDLDDLLLIELFAQRERARAQARALRELFWTDIALNWFAPAQKLGGARSRDYDYLRGLGHLDQQLMANGWLPVDETHRPTVIWLAYQQPRPSAALKQMSEQRFPRLVTQVWGLEKHQTRTHYLCRDVTLSVAGANYRTMDIPLSADLPGPHEGVRCYFIPDGRHDPYGKIKIQESKAHAKTLHLTPFWSAAQRRVDALGLAVYRDKDVPPDTQTLESHFVMPLDADAFWVGDRPVKFEKGKAAEFPVSAGDAVVLRKGTATVGVRVPWSRNRAGAPASAALVYDANPHGAVRLTVTHHVTGFAVSSQVTPGAAFWVRIGSGLQNDEDVAKWRREFAETRADVETTTNRVRVSVNGQDGPVTVGVATPFAVPFEVEPMPPRALLACDGDDIGRRILENVEPVKSFQAKRPPMAPVKVPAGKSIYWEAESGQVIPPMTFGKDAKASGGLFVWMPAKPGEKAGSSVGRVTWDLEIEKAGDYYVWGRVLAPTLENDSFHVSVSTDAGELIKPTTWATGRHKEWEWIQLTLKNEKPPMPFTLPQGKVSLQLRVREAGTQMDRLFITPDPDAKPQ